MNLYALYLTSRINRMSDLPRQVTLPTSIPYASAMSTILCATTSNMTYPSYSTAKVAETTTTNVLPFSVELSSEIVAAIPAIVGILLCALVVLVTSVFIQHRKLYAISGGLKKAQHLQAR